MQEYSDVLESNTVQEMRTMVNANFNTVRSTHAGEAFPTENLMLGMKCFRTDEKKTYTLISLDPVEWKVEAAGKEKLDREEIVSRLEFMAILAGDLLRRIPDWTGLFNRALSLEVADFADFGTVEHVTNMNLLFHECMSLNTVINFKIPESCPVKNVHGMFSKCNSLSELNGMGFKAKSVEVFSDMFNDCRKLPSLDVSAWQMEHATNMCGMFRNCWKLESLDVSKWNVENCTNFADMFMGCRRIRGLNFSSWDTSKATAMGGMFRGCGMEEVRDEGGHPVGYQYVSYVIPLKLDLSFFDLSNVETTAHMFSYARAQLTIGEKMRKTSKCKNMSYMFLNFWADTEPVIAGDEYNPSVMGTNYRGIPCKKSIFTSFDLSSVEDMSSMFEGNTIVNCTLDKSFTGKKDQTSRGLIFHVSTPKVQQIARLFASTNGAQFIDFSMDMGNVNDITGLFDGATAEFIRLRNFDTRNVGSGWFAEGTMDNLFKNCRNLRYLIIDSAEFKFKLLKDVLADLPTVCRFIVPRMMIASYKAQDFWKNYPDRFLAMEDCTLFGAYVRSAPT